MFGTMKAIAFCAPSSTSALRDSFRDISNAISSIWSSDMSYIEEDSELLVELLKDGPGIDGVQCCGIVGGLVLDGSRFTSVHSHTVCIKMLSKTPSDFK